MDPDSLAKYLRQGQGEPIVVADGLRTWPAMRKWSLRYFRYEEALRAIRNQSISKQKQENSSSSLSLFQAF